MGEEDVYTEVCWENLMEKRPLGGPSRRWVCNIKMDMQVWDGA